MKSSEQMAADVLERRDVYLKKQKATRRAIVAASLSLCCVCVVIFAGFRWLGRDLQQEQVPSLEDSTMIGEDDTIPPGEFTDDADDAVYDDALQDNTQQSGTLLEQHIEKLEELSKNGDCIGWLVYENTLYTQVQNTDIANVKTQTHVGRAFDFRGFYQIQNEINGDVYTVVGAPNQLLLQLENSGTVLLQADDSY